MGFHRENTNTTTVGYGRRHRLLLSHRPHSNSTTTAGYAGKGTESDVEAQKNGSLKESVQSNEALEPTNCIFSKNKTLSVLLIHTGSPPLPPFSKPAK